MAKPTNAQNLISASLTPHLTERVKNVMLEDKTNRSLLIRNALEVFFAFRNAVRAGHIVGVADPADRVIHTEISGLRGK